MTPTETFHAARETLFRYREDYEGARKHFRWPELDTFNWALDHFDVIAKGNNATALWLLNDDGVEEKRTFEELRVRSNQGANLMRRLGVRRGDRVLIMVPNVAALWEAMLSCIKLGAVMIPATTQLTPEDLKDRFERGGVKHVLTDSAGAAKIDSLDRSHTRLLSEGTAKGWTAWTDLQNAPTDFSPDGPTRATDPLLLYFTSGTTAKPKLVLHTHQSYPVGHLSTMYWIGLRPGDVHWNISSPGWAKHAWSNVFAPWNAGATVFVYNYARFNGGQVLDVLEKYPVTTLCAPPTVWRMLILERLEQRKKIRLREVVGAGEPLNPEIISKVKSAWGLTLRDGYGQTETTAQVGNTPGQKLKPGSMGRPLPGYNVVLLDGDGHVAEEGEICLELRPRPTGLMVGYHDDPALTEKVTRAGHYHTGDVALQDRDGYLTYVGRADDVFKASDYRISPFELESVLLEHSAVAEAALVPSPDAVRLAVPKAFIVLKPTVTPSAEVARDIFRFCKEKLAPYKRIRRIEFGDLPKTISGKVRRGQLRLAEQQRPADVKARNPNEFWIEDFAEKD